MPLPVPGPYTPPYPLRGALVDIYGRRSKREPDKNAPSIDAQVSTLERLAAENGWIVRHIWREQQTAGDFDSRPVYQQMLDDLAATPESERPGGVLFAHVDRHTRAEVRETYTQISHLFDTLGVRPIYAEGGDLLAGGLEGALMAACVIQNSADYLPTNASKVLPTHVELAGKGIEQCGAKKFGYRKQYVHVRSAEVIDSFTPSGEPVRKPQPRQDWKIVRIAEPEEAAVVRRIFDLCIAGHGVRCIAETLNRENAVAPSKSGWQASVVEKTLKDRRYLGLLIFGQRPAGKHRRFHGGEIVSVPSWERRKPPGKNEQPIVVEGVHEALIDAETFERAQQSLKSRSRGRGGGRKGAHPMLLRHMVICADCGRPMTTKGEDRYLCVTNHTKGLPVPGKKIGCHPYRISETEVADAVLPLIKRIVGSSRSEIEERVRARFAEGASELDASRAQAKRLRKQIGKLESKVSLAEKNLAFFDGDDDDLRQAIVNQWSDAKAELEEARKALAAAEERSSRNPEEEFAEQVNEALSVLDALDNRQTVELGRLRQVVQTFITRITANMTREPGKRKPTHLHSLLVEFREGVLPADFPREIELPMLLDPPDDGNDDDESDGKRPTPGSGKKRASARKARKKASSRRSNDSSTAGSSCARKTKTVHQGEPGVSAPGVESLSTPSIRTSDDAGEPGV